MLCWRQKVEKHQPRELVRDGAVSGDRAAAVTVTWFFFQSLSEVPRGEWVARTKAM